MSGAVVKAIDAHGQDAFWRGSSSLWGTLEGRAGGRAPQVSLKESQGRNTNLLGWCLVFEYSVL